MLVKGHSQERNKKQLMRDWTVRAPYHGVGDWLLSARDIFTLRVCIFSGVIVR